MPARETKQGQFVKAHFGTVWPAHLVGFTRLLVHLRARFDGDLDLVLILAVIGSRTHTNIWTQDLEEFDQLTKASDTERGQLAINIQSVADYSGIARETVRRKVTILQDRGWVMRDEDGHLAVSRKAATDLEGATGETIAYLASLLRAFEAAQSAEMG